MNISMIFFMMAIGAGLLTLHAVETIVSAFEQKGVAAVDGYMLHYIIARRCDD